MFKERLKILREEAGMMQKEVADQIGVSERVYSFYETGRFPKNEEILRRLTTCFDCTADYLLGISDFRRSTELQEISKSADVFKQIENPNILENAKDIFRVLADIGKNVNQQGYAVAHCLDNVVDSIHEIFSSYNSSVKETANLFSKDLQDLKHFEFKSYSFEKIDLINGSIKALANELANKIKVGLDQNDNKADL